MRQRTDRGLGLSIRVFILIGLLVAAIYALTADRFDVEPPPMSPAEVAARIAPIGKVALSGADRPDRAGASAGEGAAGAAAQTAAPAAGSAGEAGSAGPGAAVYNRVCQACHATGAAGAPVLGNPAAWQPRIGQGLEALVQSVMQGKGNMPPQGTCTDCTREDLKAAVSWMVSRVPIGTGGEPG